ncbi:mechanosensitive ion channel family protein [Hespellia stercorisuis]|uniref:Small conductance mechanosensitive channel n=1 Tax=Hespellia stercorisuis DSM 15480 TaxID=1121950 RepID=A0A1M6JGM3_9FIRM|nr:mechanosensitive ion channel family protein [Hespellia stercorisuis]SHJ45752.1 small conductance mechanosensitive channel [Hespellia stercorisuis DSM 15480]
MYGKKERIKRLAFDIFLEFIGLILVFFILLYAQTRFSISQQKENSAGKLDIAEERLTSYVAQAEDDLAKYDAFSQAKVDTVAYYYKFNIDEIQDMEAMAKQWDLTEMYVLDDDHNVIAAYNGKNLNFNTNSQLSDFLLTLKATTIESTRYYVSQIDAGYRLVGARDIRSLQAKQEEITSLSHSLDTIKVGLKGYIIAVNVDDQTIAYHPKASLIGKTLTEADVDPIVMEDGYAGWAASGGKDFYCESRTSTADPRYQLIAVRPKSMIQDSIMKLVWLGVLVFFLVSVIVIIYIHFIRVEQDQRYMDSHEEMEYIHLGGKIYLNRTIGGRIAHFFLLCLLIMLGASFYLQSLSALSTQFAHYSSKKADIKEIFDSNQVLLEELTAEYNAEYEQRAVNIAYILGKDPSLIDDDKLQTIANRAQIKYIYVFNGDGASVATNGINKDYVLSQDDSSQSYAFWNVVKGHQDALVQEARADDSSEHLFIQYIGVKRQDAKGMVQLAISPERLQNRLRAVQTEHVLQNIAVENNGFTMAVDSKTKKIVYYPDSDWIGRSASKIGLNKNALSDSYIGYQTLDGVKCSLSSMQYNDDYIYIVVPVTAVTSGRLVIALLITGTGFFVLLFIALLSLIGDPRKVLQHEPEDESDQPRKEPKGMFDVVTGSGKVYRVESVLSRWSSKSLWSDLSAEQKIRRVMSLFTALLGIYLLLYMYLNADTYDSTSVISYILHKHWEKVPNIFSLTYIAIIMLETIILANVTMKLISLLVDNMGARAETVARLACNFIKYMSVIGAVFYCLNFVGIKTSTLLASAGLMSLVVGLGAQSLISDILAGIFIVFEGEFRVGDIVTIGTFRGTVLEIGIRSTKIEDFSQDIKIFNNSDITGVVNMTKKYSYAFCDVGIEYNESLERVESVLKRELPLMKERLPEIESGPFYRGVVSLADSCVVIRILAQCQELKRVQLTRDMNREIKLIFDRNHINIPFPQVVVNQPALHGTASDYEKMTASNFVADQKEKTKDIKPQ